MTPEVRVVRLPGSRAASGLRICDLRLSVRSGRRVTGKRRAAAHDPAGQCGGLGSGVTGECRAAIFLPGPAVRVSAAVASPWVGACLWGASLPTPSRAQGVSSSSTPPHPTRPARPWSPRPLTRAPSPPQTRAGAGVESSEAMPGLPAPRARLGWSFWGLRAPTARAAWVGDGKPGEPAPHGASRPGAGMLVWKFPCLGLNRRPLSPVRWSRRLTIEGSPELPTCE